MALQLGATYVARGFSGDKAQLVPLIKGAIATAGAAFIDVISPCVAFNNHAGSTKSYDYVREHNEAVSRIDFMVHAGYDATDRHAALNFMQAHQARGEVVTGLLYVDPLATDLHTALNTSADPLNSLDADRLCPGSAALARLNASLR
jgi:2-oxoglutarate ferredoxin oxidoreductase subunit beta